MNKNTNITKNIVKNSNKKVAMKKNAKKKVVAKRNAKGRIVAKGGIGKIIDHVEPLTVDEQIEFNAFLKSHNLVKGPSAKRMRIYRKIAESKRGKITRSRDFIYVVSADRFRNEKEQVYKDLIALSEKVMDKEFQVKNAEYITKMSKVEEKLLMNGIEMNWYNGKSVTFNKIPHVITDRNILKHLDAYFAAKAAEECDEVANVSLKKFKIGAKISEIAKKYKLDWNKWCEHNVIMKNGEVIAAYSYKDLQPLYELHFDEGIKDKFGYNLNIIKPANLKELLKLSDDMDLDWENEMDEVN